MIFNRVTSFLNRQNTFQNKNYKTNFFKPTKQGSEHEGQVAEQKEQVSEQKDHVSQQMKHDFELLSAVSEQTEHDSKWSGVQGQDRCSIQIYVRKKMLYVCKV